MIAPFVRGVVALASAVDKNLVGSFRLTIPTIALFVEDGRQVAHKLPAGAIVNAVDGLVREMGFLDVIWDSKKISMFAMDLMSRGEKVPMPGTENIEETSPIERFQCPAPMPHLSLV